MKTVTIISQQILFSKSKSSTIIFAELLKKRGFNVKFITLNLSMFSFLKNDFRLKRIKELGYPLNKEFFYNDIECLIRFNLFHIINFRNEILNNITSKIFKKINFHDKKISNFCKKSDFIIIESSCNIVFPYLRKELDSIFIYKGNDNLDFIRTHPFLSFLEKRDYLKFDFISVTDKDMLQEFPLHKNKFVTPHGVSIPKKDFKNPFKNKTNIVFTGHTGLDKDIVLKISNMFPHIDIHLIGRESLKRDNIINYGEIPYEDIFQYIQHADICLATYRFLEKSVQYKKTIKMKIYQKMNKKILLPSTMNKDQSYPNSFFYDNNDISLYNTVERCLKTEVKSYKSNEILSWNETLQSFINRTNLG